MLALNTATTMLCCRRVNRSMLSRLLPSTDTVMNAVDTALAHAPLTGRPAWLALQKHAGTMAKAYLRDLFSADANRGTQYVIDAEGLYLDYSKQRMTQETLGLLLDLAQACGLKEHIGAMFRGERINATEDRAVLHVALRAPANTHIMLDGKDVVPEVHAVLARMASFCDSVRDGSWKGHTGKRIVNVISIGIGGSDLGPVMAYEALRHYSQREMTFRFVSNVDGTDFVEATGTSTPPKRFSLSAPRHSPRRKR